MQSSLIAAGAVILLIPLALLLWAVVTSLADDIDGPKMFARFFGLLSVIVTVVAAFLAPQPAVALAVGLGVAGLVILMFTQLT